MTLHRTTTGRLRLDGGTVRIDTVHWRTGKAVTRAVDLDLIRPTGANPQDLDGIAASMTIDISTGAVVYVDAELLEPTQPVDLDGQSGFLNPYGFVSIPDRDELPPELGDRPPTGHDRYHGDRWTGTIEITITTHTPLLIPDHAAAARSAGPSPLPVRVDHQGRPVLAGSAVKGMLRSAFEAVTNSRLGVLDGHDRRLAIRATADTNVDKRLHPAIVDDDPAGPDQISLTWVTSLDPGPLPDGRVPKIVQRAVWFPKDLIPRAEQRDPHTLRGRQLDAWMYLVEMGKTFFWRVAKYTEPGQPLALPSPPAKMVSGVRMVKVRGRLHWTGSTFPAGGHRKHDERFVVEQILDGNPEMLSQDTRIADADLITGWQAVIDSYAHAHLLESAAKRRSDYGGYVWDPKRWRDLRPGDTLYVDLDNGNVVGLYPAMIGRKPFAGAPITSIPRQHRPAEKRDELSPADRVFGWVRHGESDDGVAHRGHLKVLPPHGEGIPSRSTVHQLASSLRLTPLNGPKPAQFRFYLGDRTGAPLAGVAKDPINGYPGTAEQSRIRGRKFYLTHAETTLSAEGADAYWDPREHHEPTPLGGATRFREYLAADKSSGRGGEQAEDRVSTVVSQWVKAGTTFKLTLQVDNLDDTELGALLWLLTLPDPAMHKLGLGKPLGFGAVHIAIDQKKTRLFSGDQLRDRYLSLAAAQPTDLAAALQLSDAFDGLLREHLPTVRTEFLTAARGAVGVPVHYPRVGDASGNGPVPPVATTYQWWVDNDKVANQPGKEKGDGLALGSLAKPTSLVLPYRPSTTIPEKTDGRPGRGRGGQPGGRGQRRGR